MPPLPLSHVIFDLDGTLLDTEPLYTLAAQTVVGRYGKIFDAHLKRDVMGGGPLAGAAVVVERLKLPITPEEYLARREEILLELFRDVRPMDGAEQLVQALYERAVPLAIGTSSSKSLCELKLARHAFRTRFEVVVCSDDPEVQRAKPSPDIFLVAARRMGADPSRCLVFEDTAKGVAAARAAGMQAIAVPDPRMPSMDFSGALRVVPSLSQVDLVELGLLAPQPG